MSLRDLLSPTLQGESRVQGAEPVLRRIFANEMYEVFAGLYPGGLLTTLVHYRREELRIMSRLGEVPVITPEKDAWVKAAVGILQEAGKGPFHLIRDAKLETRVQLSLHDRAALKMANVEIPRSAGRYKDLFLQDS